MDNEVHGKTYAREIMGCEVFAAQTLSGMVVGNLQTGNMPPTDIFKWFGTLIAYHLAQAELDSLNEPALREKLEERVQEYVTTLRLVLDQAKAEKMLVFEDELRGVLKARKLHLPTHFDATYGGMLP